METEPADSLSSLKLCELAYSQRWAVCPFSVLGRLRPSCQVLGPSVFPKLYTLYSSGKITCGEQVTIQVP